jgi:ABC-type nitrate/sulfonate/bicarbonate transport system substrate-binding protein
LKDAKGKKIGITSPTGTTRAAAALALQAIGLAGQAELIVSGSASASWAAIKRGAIDIAWANNLSAAPLILSGEARSVGTISDYEPSFPDDFIIAGIPLIQKSPEVVKNFLKAYEDVVDFIQKNPDVAVQAYAKAAKVEEAVARHAISLINMKNFFDLDIKPDYLRTTQEAMRQMGLLKREFSEWKQLINQDFLPDGVARHSIPDKIPFAK